MSGCLLSVGAAFLLFGSWTVSVKSLAHDDRVKGLWIALTHLLGSIPVFFLSGSEIIPSELPLAYLAGLIWGCGNMCCFVSLRHLGITRAFAIWVSGAILVNLCWGLFFFEEFWSYSPQQLQHTAVAVALVIAAAALVISSREHDAGQGNFKLGLLAALGVPLFHGSYYVPLKSGTASMYASFVPLGLGMLTITFVFARAHTARLSVSLPDGFRLAIGGLMLLIGNYYYFESLHLCGVSLSGALVQFAVVINTLWGVFYFREVRSKAALSKISIAVGLMLIGTFLLGMPR